MKIWLDEVLHILVSWLFISWSSKRFKRLNSRTRETIWTQNTLIWWNLPTRWNPTMQRNTGPLEWHSSSVNSTNHKTSKSFSLNISLNFLQLFYIKSQIQKEELGSLISSIKALENCIQPFLDECDTDGNDLISDAEWGKCLDLSDSESFYILSYN